MTVSEAALEAADPYRVLFAHSTTAAAVCRLRLAGATVVGVDILDANPAFERMRGVASRLVGLFTRVRSSRKSASQVCDLASERVVATAHPLGDERALLLLEDRTEASAPERRAAELQARFEQVFHGNAAAMVIASRHDLRILDVNARWLELFEATRDEVIGRTTEELELITPSRARARIAEHQLFSTGYDVELELRTRKGARLTVLASARPIELAEGACTLTTLLDITSRKLAEDAFAVAFSASPAGMVLVDVASDCVVAVNDRLLEMTGEVRGCILGRRMTELDFVAQSTREQLLAQIDRNGRLDGVELELACKTGPAVCALASTELVMLLDRPHRLTAFTDITARKRFERRLVIQQEIGRRLAESDSIDTALLHVLEELGRGEAWDRGTAWLVNDDGALERRVAWSGAEPPPGLAVIDRTPSGLLGGVVERVRETGFPEKLLLDPTLDAAASDSLAVVFPILRANSVLGVVIMAAGRCTPDNHPIELRLFEAVGRLVGLSIERMRGEAALRELNSQLERRVVERTQELESLNRNLEAFNSSVSHDLRAPLRAVHSFSQILLDDYAEELPADAKALLGRIHASGGRLRNMIDQLLAFSRLGTDKLQRGIIDLDALVNAVVEELLVGRDTSSRTEIRMSRLGECHADPALLRLVWTNLIDNALKYSRTRPRIEIEIGREQRGDVSVFFVRDNGVGFDMKHVDRLFGVFERLHAATEFEGTGIGLANVRRIIERHRGRVAAFSTPGQGSQFEFTLGIDG